MVKFFKLILIRAYSMNDLSSGLLCGMAVDPWPCSHGVDLMQWCAAGLGMLGSGGTPKLQLHGQLGSPNFGIMLQRIIIV